MRYEVWGMRNDVGVEDTESKMLLNYEILISKTRFKELYGTAIFNIEH